MSLFGLSGQTAIVTGAATGIGEAIARRLAKAGATVAVADINRDGAALIAASIGGKSLGVQVDVATPDSVEAAVAEVLKRTRKIDILVNNAGIAGKAAPIWEQTDADWQAIIAINLTGVFNFSRAVIPHMREHKYGRIVNIASIAGKEGNPNMSGYSATKAAVIGLTKSIAKEVATEGICINSVAPAVIHTRLIDNMRPEQVEYMTSRIPMRRIGTTEEVAAVVHFLSSPECSFVTGQCYDVSGGRATY